MQSKTPNDSRCSDVAQHNAQWMTRADLVLAIGGDEQNLTSVESARQEAQQVERGLVGPMDIFEDQDPRPRSAAQLRQQCTEHVLPCGLLAELALEFTTETRGDVQ